MKCVGSFFQIDKALEELGTDLYVDVVVMELNTAGSVDGLEGITQFKRRQPLLKVIIFSWEDRREAIYEAFRAGANGYLFKSASRQKLIEAIERAHEGGSPLSQGVAEQLVEFFQRRRPLLAPLSPIERRITELLERGGAYKQIAADLGISINTLKTHVRRILQKTGLESMRAVSYLRRQAL